MLASLAAALSLALALAEPTASTGSPTDGDLARARAASIREHYTKYEHRIPMRDGVHLFTAVYLPKDDSKPHPFLIFRTPYGISVGGGDPLKHYGVDYSPGRLGPSEEFEAAGYIFVQQEVRGRFLSEGRFVEMTPVGRGPGGVDESTDLHDTMEWLLKRVPGHNGKAGIWGGSYPGFYAAASIIDTHPAIKAASPQAPMTDLYMGDDSYHGGAFMLAANFDFYATFGRQQNPTPLPAKQEPFEYGTPDGYEYFLARRTLGQIEASLPPSQRELWHDQATHDTYDDYWKSRNLAPWLKNIRCAVLTVGGWFDAEDLQGPFSTYQAIKGQNPGIYSGLVIGPWTHNGWNRYDGERLGDVHFDAKTAVEYRKNVLFPFFEHYLRGAAKKDLPEATVFETGTNVWRHYPSWPPAKARARTLYFGAGGRLAFEAPALPGAFDDYMSDPGKPVPFVGYPATEVPSEYMVSDQRFAATRTDVLVYRTEPLEEDLTVAGPVSPRLFVSTSGTDSDWVVKLIDVYPPDLPSLGPPPDRHDARKPGVELGGYQQLVRGEPLRGKFRNSFEKPEPFTPGKVEAVSFQMPDINHTFRRGHRIMVQVQSSWFPLIDLNPQTFVEIPRAKVSDFKPATQRVYRSQDLASGVELRILP